MTQEIRTIYGPEYLKNFQCIMTNCEETCCMRWIVNVDLKTYKKYKNLNDPEISPIVDKYIEKNSIFNSSSTDTYAKLILDENKACSLLDENKLCRMQLKYGESYLSVVCDTFPKITNIIDDKTERSLTLSCPEAARIVLLNEKPMRFISFSEPVNKRICVRKRFSTKKGVIFNALKKYFYPLRMVTIDILQNRKFKIWERLIILGIFYKMVDDLILTAKVNAIPDLIGRIPNLLKQNKFRENLLNIDTIYVIQIKLLKELSEGITTRKLIDNYVDCFNEFLQGIGYTDGANDNDIINKYKEAYSKYYEPFMKDHEYIIENYLVNYVYKNLFPFTLANSPFDSYIIFIIHYSLIKLHLIGMAGYHKKLTKELVIKLFFSFSKTFEHNQKYFLDVLNLMKLNKFNDLTYMSILIKN